MCIRNTLQISARDHILGTNRVGAQGPTNYWNSLPKPQPRFASAQPLGLDLPSPACQLIKYGTWDEVKHSDLGVFWTPLQFTPTFITRMRLSTPFSAVSVVLMLTATLFSLVGHCNADHKTLVACGLYTVGGLSLASGLVVFASVLSDAYMDRPRRSQLQQLFDYRYGWSFFAAGAAFIMAEFAALISITAYLRRFPTVEDMVRAMVPGAERRLRVRHQQAEFLVRRQASAGGYACERQPGTTKGDHGGGLVASELEGVDGPLLTTSRTPPDVCTTPGVTTPGGVGEERGGRRPPSHLAGTTVPITLMQGHRQARHPPSNAPPTLLEYHQRFADCTLVHQGVLGVSEGAGGVGTSSSSASGSSASSAGAMTSTGSSASSKSFHHHAPSRQRKQRPAASAAAAAVFVGPLEQPDSKSSPVSIASSQGYCSGSAV
ncbi:hypothetical protein LSTR_LSTR005008 [Laodelphax striatellus]|uniref:Voltage-dependent calcium channel gamma-5 subunit n=1 Tax=Laodelphax striatellus TaxID=195883 RepID=A0A482XIQ1_LAOST|nr:hypothetical protein LSTR_LSTR005008 [Laodelphax striatellus]